MADIKAKMVRTLSPAGVSLNYTGICGDSHFYYPVLVTSIKKMIDRGVLVYEYIDATDDEEAHELLLTNENYDQDNGGAEVAEEANIIPDIELEVEQRHATERAAWLEEKGLEIKARQEAIAKEFLGIAEEEEENIDDTSDDSDDTSDDSENETP